MASFLSSGQPPPLSPVSHQDALESAARLIDKHILDDKNYLEPSELLKVSAHNKPTTSGLHDFDYPSLLEVGMGMDSLQEISTLKRVPLPPELVEQFERMQCNCMMGLYPEIERAWLTIDSDIFVWRYEDGGDLAYFDGLNETILCAGLVHPKPGIFQSHIQYLMCLATPVDIVLLGVTFTRPQEGSFTGVADEMHLLPDPLFSIPTDNTYIMSIMGSDNGRIFMAGKDGCLYELVYQAEDGWFSRKCRKINHSTSTLSFLVPSFLNFTFSEDDPLIQISIDNSRHILYGRTEKGNIQVFDLGKDGKGMSKVASMNLRNIVHFASNISSTIDRSNFEPFVHIESILNSESSNCHLLVITQSGVRLYFTTNPFGSDKGRPTMLALMHVRLPPGFSANSIPKKPENIHMSYYKQGTLLLVSSQSPNQDLLWTVSNDSFPFQQQLMETQTMVPIDGKSWALCEVPNSLLQPTIPQEAMSLPNINPPAVVTQHKPSVRKFVLLSAQGSHIFTKLRPVDQLRQLLLDYQGPESDEVRAFFRLHKIDQACATCLILACSRLAGDPQVTDWARMAFFTYGGEALYNFSSGSVPPSNIGSFSSPGPMSPSTTMMYGAPGTHGSHTTTFSGLPTPGFQPMQMSTPVPSVNQSMYRHPYPPLPSYMQEIIFSGKHNGICIYFTRIVRSLWDSFITTDFPFQTPHGTVNYLTCSFTSEELSSSLEQIRDLSDFVDFNSRFDTGPSEPFSTGFPATPHMMPMRFEGGHMDEQSRKRMQAEAQKIEKASLQNIQELFHRIEETIGLLKIMVDHQFHIITVGLSKDQQNQLKTMTFKQLAVNGKEMCSSLITCLINRYLDDNATIDAINTRLREICPTLYSSDDATCSKANELLQAARVNQNQLEKRRQLREALKLFKDVHQPLQLPVICNQFASVQFYEGIVDLCLASANKRDPQKLALHFYNRGEPAEDVQGMQAYMQRIECYKCISETLNHLWSTSVAHPQAPSVPKSPGPPSTPDPGLLSAKEAEQFKNEVFSLALKSEDQLFHVSLYDWLFSNHLTEKLLEIQSQHLEPYLKRKAGLQSEATPALDLLWKFYEKNQNFSSAAKILSKLAGRHGNDIPLQQRLEYLSRAIMCAKSSTQRGTSSSEGEFLHELEEKMEVARIQLQIQKSLGSLNVSSQHINHSLKKLDSDLMDITTLYEEFADRFDLHECKLAIVHCAGLYDAALIENLWQSVIEKEIAATASAPTEARMTSLHARIVSIAKPYCSAERYFPLAFILKHLEQRSSKLNFDPKWVFKILLDLGVNACKLLELYDRLFKSRDPYWQSIAKPLHLLVVLYELLSHLVSAPSLIPGVERRAFTNVSLDFVAAYLVELQATSSTIPQVRLLVRNFKELQSRLERM